MLKVVSLVENTCMYDNLKSEHGLSLYIEKDNLKCLLDTGASDKFLKNAKNLNIDLKELDWVIISHCHSDHVGGLRELLEYNKKVKIIIKNTAKSEFYLKKLFINRYIGIDKDIYEKYNDRFVFFDRACKISDSFFLRSDTVKDPYFVCKDNSLMEKKNNVLIPDKFNHELFLTIDEGDKIIIISSCSHSGIVNIVNTTRQLYPSKNISHIIGGFHMMGFGLNPLNCSKEYIHEVSDILDEACSDKILTCHCTGKKAYKIMKDRIGNKIDYFSCGESIEVN